MLKDRFDEEKKILHLQIDENLANSFDLILAFVNSNSSDAKLRLDTLMLGADILDLTASSKGNPAEETLISSLITEAHAIVNKVEKIDDVESRKIQQKTEQIRNHFSNQRADKVVFKGENIRKRQGSFELMPISLELKLGNITSVVGKNGNGKSTLLKMIAGEISIDDGKLIYPLFGETNNWRKLKQQIAYIPQELSSFNRLGNLRDILHFTASAKGISEKENRENVDYLILRLGLKKYEKFPWQNLSGGYKLRFELARQLVWEPKLLIMDEPLANLDIKAQRSLIYDLRNITNSLKTPISIILSSQNLFEVENVSDEIICLENGSAIYNGRVSDIAKSKGTNSFLLGTETSTSTLWKIFNLFSPKISHIYDSYGEKVIVTDSELISETILSHLITHKIKINYFRDISNSTRTYFENEIPN